MERSEPCDKRPIRFLGIWEEIGWQWKAYTIAYRGAPIHPNLLDAARALAQEATPANRAGTHGVGYVGVHQGRGFNVVFADWWANENELFHRMFVSQKGEPHRLDPPTDPAFSACVWDMRVMAHERDAWLDCVLRNPDGPDLDAYLKRELNEDA